MHIRNLVEYSIIQYNSTVYSRDDNSGGHGLHKTQPKFIFRNHSWLLDSIGQV